jgi:hypothetical protein
MESKRLVLPEHKNYEYAYELAFKLACEQLARLSDIEQQCLKSGAQYRRIDSRETVIIQYLNQSYIIALPGIEISLVGSAEEVPTRDKVLILHYFTSAKGTPLADRLITFRELPEGSVYSPTFHKRTVPPLLDYFGKEPHLLVDAGEKLGGHKSDYGDTAVTINVFSRVPITIILWRGDEELTPQGSVTFDATIPDYLSTEDITILCETITWRLIKYLRGA